MGLVDASPAQLKSLKDAMDKLDKIYEAKGADMTQFPTLKHDDPVITKPGSNIVAEYPEPPKFGDAEAEERIDGVLTKGPLVL